MTFCPSKDNTESFTLPSFGTISSMLILPGTHPPSELQIKWGLSAEPSFNLSCLVFNNSIT
jgi:hypothetical protein